MSLTQKQLGVALIVLAILLVIFQILALMSFVSLAPNEWLGCGFWNGAFSLATGILAIRNSQSLRTLTICTIVLSAIAMPIDSIGLNVATTFSTLVYSSIGGIRYIHPQLGFFVANYPLRMGLSWAVVIFCSLLLASIHKTKQINQSLQPSPYPVVGGVMVAIGHLLITFQVMAGVSFYMAMHFPFTGVWTGAVVIANGILAIENMSALRGMTISSIICGLLVLLHQIVVMGIMVYIYSSAGIFDWSFFPAVVELLLGGIVVVISSRLVHQINKAKCGTGSVESASSPSKSETMVVQYQKF